IFAEVTPKTVAIRRAERLALLAAGPVDALAGFLRPVLWFITLVSRAITGGRAARAPYLTEEELMTLLHVSEEQGVIEEEEPVVIVNDREALVDAAFPMGELNEQLELGLEDSEDYDSVGGYVLATLGQVPEMGATFDSGGVHWVVEKVNGRRIVQVRLRS